MSRKKYLVRKLTSLGLETLENYVEAAAGQPGRISQKAPPVELLEDDRMAISIGAGEITVRYFEKKFDLGMALLVDLGRESVSQLLKEPTVWPWLSLAFQDSIFPKKDGGWFVGDRPRHILGKVKDRSQDQSHRHLVQGAVVAVYRFGPEARVLSEGASEQGKIEEQIMSRRRELPLATSTEVVKALHRLYWDSTKNRVRKGAKGDGGGGIMRLVSVLRQFDATHDVPSIRAERLCELLPSPEFARFLQPM